MGTSVRNTYSFDRPELTFSASIISTLKGHSPLSIIYELLSSTYIRCRYRISLLFSVHQWLLADDEVHKKPQPICPTPTPPSQPTRRMRSSCTESSLNPASSLGAVDAQLPANHDPSSNLTSEPPPACSNAESHPTPIPAPAPISTAPARETATALPPGMQTTFRIQGKFILYFSPSHRSNL